MSVQVRVEPSLTIPEHVAQPTLTESISVGIDVPAIVTSRSYTFIEVISEVIVS